MPDFSDPTLFPTFRELPAVANTGNATTSTGSADGEGSWTLLAQIKENMTITKPTLIATDRSGVDFAIIFEEPGFSLKGFRKGYTLLVPGARRTEREEVGKKAVVRVEQGLCGGVRVIPGSLEQAFELALVVQSGGVGQKCAACGKADGVSLSRCTGCSTATYCSKNCQVKGWSELGHKANCKVLKSIKEVWA